MSHKVEYRNLIGSSVGDAEFPRGLVTVTQRIQISAERNVSYLPAEVVMVASFQSNVCVCAFDPNLFGRTFAILPRSASSTAEEPQRCVCK